MSSFLTFLKGVFQMFSTNSTKKKVNTPDPLNSSYIKQVMKKNNVSVISYAIIENNTIRTVNNISLDPAMNVSSHSLYQACSFSKSLTAYAILKLIADNRILLDAPLNDQLHSWKIPECKYANKVTIRQCLNMTSGFCYSELNTTFPGYQQNEIIPSLDDILQGNKPAHNPPIKLSFEPGSQYYYSGAGFMVLQKLIEDVTQQSFTEYMRNEILIPLKMLNSTFQCPLPDILKDDAITGSNANGEIYKNGWENIVTSASGGLWSTSTDIANFILAITNAYLGIDNTNIHYTLVQEMLSHQSNSSFGLGVSIDGLGNNLNFRKNGHNNAYHNEFIMFPHTGQGMVIMTNSPNGITVINELMTFFSNKYQWPAYSKNFNELTIATNTNRIHP